ncbi:hypothetical protein HCH_06728 [Hahella chejuensis KCTC 2396]|uniref:Uncharacterized protein n=1 Tax=Hahella chejuensis (strain KCTC 2396) TaxID=349521 RepID=Q2S7M0_HAHCH|nr:hypothetical protein [Hahella chejuensis]ABC33354.1 hypothetical protein HCH_06728 [Hahella chejuensis KCTC 2396]
MLNKVVKMGALASLLVISAFSFAAPNEGGMVYSGYVYKFDKGSHSLGLVRAWSTFNKDSDVKMVKLDPSLKFDGLTEGTKIEYKLGDSFSANERIVEYWKANPDS